MKFLHSKRKNYILLFAGLIITLSILFLLGQDSNRITVCNEEIISKNASLKLKNIFNKYKEIIIKRMKSSNLPGASIVITNKDEILWAAGFGYTDRKNGKPVDTETIFSLQSNSKTFTAMGVLTAVRDKKLDLDEPITTYLPGFTVNSRFEKNPEKK